MRGQIEGFYRSIDEGDGSWSSHLAGETSETLQKLSKRLGPEGLKNT